MNRRIPIILLVILIFLAVRHPTIDPDLGWHLRQGQYFFETGTVLRTNIFSFVWPDFAWVQTSWLFDVAAYALFSLAGFFGLAAVSALLTTGTFLLMVRSMGIRKPSVLIPGAMVFLTQSATIYSMGLRSQTVSAFFYTVLITLVCKPHLFDLPRIAYLRRIAILPILFFLWANFHAGFFIGIIVLTVLWISHGIMIFISEKKALLKNVALRKWLVFPLFIGLSVLSPLVNPWGIRIYREIWGHITNANLPTVMEWEPLFRLPFEAIVLLSLVLFITVLCIKTQKIRSIPANAVLGTLTILSLTAFRFVMLLGITMTYVFFLLFQNRAHSPFPIMILRIAAIATTLFLIIDMTVTNRYLTPPSGPLLGYSWDTYCRQSGNCSEEITSLMRKNPPRGNGFHPYTMGGYLTFRVPEVKTFVDGRMTAWQKDGATPPVDRGDLILTETIPINLKLFDTQYRLTWAILPAASPNNRYLESLVSQGVWRKEYQDQSYSYYTKVK